MKYMSFNSSCSYAGVANMLEQYGFDTEDKIIAIDIGLPYLFSYKNGVYLAGPMLQTAEWFNLYLNPRRFSMSETVIPKNEVCRFFQNTKCAMIGVEVSDGNKHAVVFAVLRMVSTGLSIISGSRRMNLIGCYWVKKI